MTNWRGFVTSATVRVAEECAVWNVSLLVLFFACSCLFVFVVISSYGQTVQYVEFPRYIRSVESGAQRQFTSSLFERRWPKIVNYALGWV